MCLPAPLCEHFPPSCSFKGVLKFNHIVLHQCYLEIFQRIFLGEMPTCLNPNFLWKWNFNQVFQQRQISDWGGSTQGDTHALQPTSSQTVCAQACIGGIWFSLLGQGKGRGGLAFQSSPGPLSYPLFGGRGSNTPHFTNSAALPLPPISPPRKELLLSESTTQWKPKTSVLLSLRGKTEARTDAQQAVTISFPQSLQHSQPQPAAQLLSCPAFKHNLKLTRKMLVFFQSTQVALHYLSATRKGQFSVAVWRFKTTVSYASQMLADTPSAALILLSASTKRFKHSMACWAQSEKARDDTGLMIWLICKLGLSN